MKYLLSFASSVLVAAILISLAPVHGEAGIYSDVIRLHVIAESDSDEDQALKLKVRDAVLDCVSESVAECHSYAEAYAVIDGMKNEIRESAANCVLENGGDCAVSVILGREEYPRRDYGDAVMPAGVYDSLRVVLGEGEGHNWWCVLFPSVCMKFASADDYSSVGLTPAEYRVITGQSGRVKVRFRLLEIISSLVGRDY